MVHQSEDRTPSKAEQRKRPYKKPTLTEHLVNRAEKEMLIAKQDDKSKAADRKG